MNTEITERRPDNGFVERELPPMEVRVSVRNFTSWRH